MKKLENAMIFKCFNSFNSFNYPGDQENSKIPQAGKPFLKEIEISLNNPLPETASNMKRLENTKLFNCFNSLNSFNYPGDQENYKIPQAGMPFLKEIEISLSNPLPETA